VRIAIGQINTTVGDLVGNCDRIVTAVESASAAGAQLVLFPELAICGYPPLDLVTREDFVAAVERATDTLANRLKGQPPVVVGTLRRSDEGAARPVHNSTAIIENGAVVAHSDKVLLPTYDVFDESRTFEPGGPVQVHSIAGHAVGIAICEDLWTSRVPGQISYRRDPGQELIDAGAEIILCPSASPFRRGKSGVRRQLFRDQAARYGVPIVLANLVGGNTELIFDGASMMAHPDRSFEQFTSFEEQVGVVGQKPSVEVDLDPVEEIASALVLGIRDYFHKCHIDRAVLGLSGGIDSAVTALLAVEALGADQVMGIAMPGPYSSRGSLEDSRDLAQKLGINLEEISVNSSYRALRSVMEPLLGEGEWGVAQENLQARIRGTVLMTVANRQGAMVLATGNKSELSVGYCTLYGDMCGGLAPLGDVRKREVYAIAQLERFRGRVPQETIDKAPSAELAPHQRDEDTLPPYQQLDEVLEAWIEGRQSGLQIQQQGHDAEMVRRVIGLIESSEHKRRQSAPILRVSPRAFGLGRRVPIARSLSGWQLDDLDRSIEPGSSPGNS
jgi:NAD+ synthetase